MTRAVLYCRQSEARRGETEESSLSLDAQETILREWATKESWNVVAVVRDHDRKGDDPVRPGLLDIKRMAATRQMDVLCVLNMSRFARDNLLQEMVFRELRAFGVTVASRLEPSIEHTVMRGVLGVLSQYQREQMGQAIAGVIRERARQGQSSGTAAYGFRRIPISRNQNERPVYKLVPEPDEARVVKLVFDRYAAGWSIGSLVRWLNADPTVPPRPRGRWSRATVAALLRIETYAGVVAITGDGLPGFPAVRVEDAHEAIVDRATFLVAQKRLGSGAPRSREDKREHSWMEGVVFCAGCGEPMYFVARVRTLREGKMDRSWNCRRAIMHRQGVRGEPCPAGKAKAGAGWVERTVDARIGRDLAKAGKATDATLRRYLPKDDGARVNEIDREVRKLASQRDNLIDAIKSGADVASVLAPELARVHKSITALETERANLRAGATLATLQRARVYAADIGAAWARADPATKREAALSLGVRIEVDAASRTVTIEYGPGFEWLASG